MCPICHNPKAKIVKSGFFSRDVGTERKVQRYRCQECGKRFSDQTHHVTYRERKPELTRIVMSLLMGGMSQRECARNLGVKQKTVSDKLKRLGLKAKQNLAVEAPPIADASNPRDVVQFDEMETFEHSKCKPLSIALGVDPESREILSAEVSTMPAKGKLAAISRKKYGWRKDQRKTGLKRMMTSIKWKRPRLKKVVSDQSPRYPSTVGESFPNGIEHQTHKGRRGCVVGQGELKRGGFDPLFALNHTAAMFRDRVKRLSRRTWCTTKKADFLQYLVDLYSWWHNQHILGVKTHKIPLP